MTVNDHIRALLDALHSDTDAANADADNAADDLDSVVLRYIETQRAASDARILAGLVHAITNYPWPPMESHPPGGKPAAGETSDYLRAFWELWNYTPYAPDDTLDARVQEIQQKLRERGYKEPQPRQPGLFHPKPFDPVEVANDYIAAHGTTSLPVGGHTFSPEPLTIEEAEILANYGGQRVGDHAVPEHSPELMARLESLIIEHYTAKAAGNDARAQHFMDEATIAAGKHYPDIIRANAAVADAVSIVNARMGGG